MHKVVFVYNADTGLMNGMFDFFHKLVKPDTYQCSLCKVTHNMTGMRNAWKSYLDSLALEKDFYHRDEFKKQFPEWTHHPLPAVFLLKDEELTEIITAENLNQLDLPQLIDKLREEIMLCKVDFTDGIYYKTK